MSETRTEAYKRRRDERRASERALSVDGVYWYEAKMPRRFHRCYAHTTGVVGLNLVERCACGAIRYSGSGWMEKNSRRKEARK